MRRGQYVFIILISCFLNEIHGNIPFKNIGLEEGISNNWVFAVKRDSYGYLWIGTMNGLNRWDGYEMKSYFHHSGDSNSISSNLISFIFEDSGNTIYVGTNGGGLCEYNEEENNWNRIFMGRRNNDYFANVLDMEERIPGELWIVSEYSGIGVLDRNNDTVFRYVETIEKDGISQIISFKSVELDKNGNLWFGATNGALYCFKSADKTFEKIPLPGYEGLFAKKLFHSYLYLHIDSENNLWIGTQQNGLWLYSINTNRFTRFPVSKDGKGVSYSSVVDIQEYTENKIWIATDNGGINIYDKETGTFSYLKTNNADKFSISSNGILNLSKDNQDNLWIATFDGGVDYYSPFFNDFQFFYNVPNENASLPHNNIKELAQDNDGQIWIGTDGRGLITFSDKTKDFKRFSYPSETDLAINSQNISGLYASKNGNLFVGSFQNGFSIYNYQNHTIKQYNYSEGCTNCPGSNFIRYFMKDSEGYIWIASFGSGVDRFDPEKEIFTNYSYDPKDSTSINDYKVNIIYEDNRGNIWFGSDYKGLCRFNRGQNNFISYKLDIGNNSFELKQIRCIIEDNSENLWIGTHGGLIKMNLENEQAKTFFTDTDSISLDIYNMIYLDTVLWINTQNNIYKYNLSKNILVSYMYSQNLLSNQYNINSGLYSSSGNIYFGGTNGLISFNPSSLNENYYLPKIVLSEFRIKNIESLAPTREGFKNINTVESIRLTYKDYIFSIKFAALDLVFPEAIRYRFMLEGFDRGWIETTAKQRIATYTNLPGGKYKFIVQSTNNKGEWVNNTRSVQITVIPPFWKTNLFKLVMLLLFLMIGIIVHNIRIRIINQQKIRLEQQVKERTQDLLDKNEEILSQTALIEEQKQLAIEQRDKIELQKAELIKYQKHLETLVDIRTKKLIKAKKKAEESDKLKSSFLSNISHEIRTPLNAINGFLEVLNNPDITEDQRNTYKQYIRKSSDDLINLISDIIIFARIDSGDIKINKQEFIISNALEELKTKYKSLLVKAKPQLTLEYKIPESKDIIYTDRNLLVHILTHLLDNAIKFTEEGYVKYGYTTKDHHFVFFVKDSGIGIKETLLKNIFKYFYRGESDIQNAYRGIGIGLTICRDLVNLLGGEISVESEYGKGSRFFFTLPVK